MPAGRHLRRCVIIGLALLLAGGHTLRMTSYFILVWAGGGLFSLRTDLIRDHERRR